MQLKIKDPTKLEIAIQMRRKGFLQSEIANEIGVAKSTLHGWFKSIKLTSQQEKVIQTNLTLRKQKQYIAMNRARRKNRLVREQAIQEMAADVIDRISLNTQHKQLLCAIFFWCEGGKDTSSGWQFINSDPIMIKTFLSLLRSSFNVDEAKFRALVHLHDYHDPELQQDFWSKVTGISRKQFHKPFLKPHTGKQKKPNYPGCISIRYLDRQFGLLLQMLYTNFGKTF